MKTIVKVLLSMLAVVLISQCENDEPNPVVTIPDNNFLSALIDLGVDANGDGIISREEAEVIISLDVAHRSIADLTGIEAFVNLENLHCGSNQLTSLDVSNCTALQELWLRGNQLTSLDVSNNTALNVIRINQMPSLNKVCVWEMPFPPDGVHVDTTNSPNVYFTADCTGGD